MASIIIRILWFVVVGWWLGLIWISISLILMATIVLFPFGAYMISKTWEIMTLKSSPEKVIGDVQNRSKTSTSKVRSTTTSAGSKEFFRIKPAEFNYLKFDTTKNAKLEYSMTVHHGPSINTIVTYDTNIDEFKKSTNIGWVKDASALNTDSTYKKSIINPGNYVLILDNSGRLSGQTSSGTAEVEVQYQITN